MPVNYSELIEASLKARKFSYSPYSKFAVGAALLTGENRIFTGSNVECASYSLCICAERVAFSKAVSEGYTDFRAISIATSRNAFIYPCGACRQFMHEFGKNLDIILVKSRSKFIIKKLSDLLPGAFDKKSLNISI